MILVVVEQRGGKLNRATWETIAAAQELGRVGASGPTASTDPTIAIVVLGSKVDTAASDVAAARVAKVVVIDHQALDAYTPDGYAAALEQAIARLSPSHVLLPH